MPVTLQRVPSTFSQKQAQAQDKAQVVLVAQAWAEARMAQTPQQQAVLLH
jgi:hypothetical protein